MKNLNYLIWVFLIFSLLLNQSCKENDLISSTNDVRDLVNKNGRISIDQVAKKELDQEMILGEKLKIPYEIKNVRKVHDSLKIIDKSFKPFNIKENYYYVRFKPKNIEEYDTINNDSTLNTFNHPLDYQVIKNGSKYRDKELSDKDIEYIYCVIPANNSKYDKVKYEILEKLYIPFGSGGKDEMSKNLEKNLDRNLMKLDVEILEATGYKDKTKKAKISNWTPVGHIRVANAFGSNNFVAVQGCKVRTTRALVITHSGITNTEGLYIINHTYNGNNQATYDIKWERDDYDIRSGNYVQAYTNGPNQSGGWNLNIVSNAYLSYLYAWANNAANYYYYSSHVMGIQAPPRTSPRPPVAGVVSLLLPQRMKIGVAIDSSPIPSHYFDFNSAWFAAQIAVRIENSANPQRIFEVTCHELGHASHWSLGYTTADYVVGANFNRKYAESWAQCIGWFATAKYFSPNRYVNFNNIIFPQNVNFNVYPGGGQQQNPLAFWQGDQRYYTPAFIDLIDNFQLALPETASNYTLGQLEASVARRPKNWHQIRDQIFNDYPTNPSRNQVITIFNTYRPQ